MANPSLCDEAYAEARAEEVLEARLEADLAKNPTIRDSYPAAFKVKDGDAVYLIAEVTPQYATDHGCQGARHVLWSDCGPLPRTLGTAAVVTGKTVRIPGWGSRHGQLSVFTPWHAPTDDPDFVLKGWVAPW